MSWIVLRERIFKKRRPVKLTLNGPSYDFAGYYLAGGRLEEGGNITVSIT
jgi:hypothetical protein